MSVCMDGEFQRITIDIAIKIEYEDRVRRYERDCNDNKCPKNQNRKCLPMARVFIQIIIWNLSTRTIWYFCLRCMRQWLFENRGWLFAPGTE